MAGLSAPGPVWGARSPHRRPHPAAPSGRPPCTS